jgi:hypothetical protein
MNGITNSLIILFIAFFFQKAEAEWYWWVVLGILVVLDEFNEWRKKWV